jgi:hypothetical protein
MFHVHVVDGCPDGPDLGTVAAPEEPDEVLWYIPRDEQFHAFTPWTTDPPKCPLTYSFDYSALPEDFRIISWRGIGTNLFSFFYPGF